MIYFVDWQEHGAILYCPKVSWAMKVSGHGADKMAIILLILLIKFNLNAEMINDKKRDIIFAKSYFFS